MPDGTKIEEFVGDTLKETQDYFIDTFCEGITDNPQWNENMKNQIIEVEDNEVSGYQDPIRGSVPGAAAVAAFAVI